MDLSAIVTVALDNFSLSEAWRDLRSLTKTQSPPASRWAATVADAPRRADGECSFGRSE